MSTRFFLLTAALFATTFGTSLADTQSQQPLPVAGSWRRPFPSPDVQPDRKILFRVSAAKASDVKLRFDGKEYPATKDDRGVWSVTVGPVEPDIYEYNFVVGGAKIDPGFVEVPGKPPRYDQLQEVPHGSINVHAYFSKVQNRHRNLRVYVPPQYYTDAKRKFPVFYLFNGQDEVMWSEIGRVNVVLDNLIAQHKAVPMIVVMPNNTIVERGLSSNLDTIGVIEKELPGEIIPMIEKNYRVLTDRNNRAIAGLSFGGGTAFGVGMRQLDRFAYVGEFGSGTFGGLENPKDGYVSYLRPYDPEKIAPGIYKNLVAPATKLKLFYMSCGETDPRLSFQKQAFEDFKQHGIEPVFASFPGGHDFRFFRRAMSDYATRIFK